VKQKHGHVYSVLLTSPSSQFLNQQEHAMTQPIPPGYHTLTPYLVVDGAADAIAFYTKAFGAEEVMRLEMPGSGKLGHAEMRLGDSIMMIGDAMPEFGAKAPGDFGGSPMSLMIYVPDVDAMVERAVQAGATIVRPIENHFYGDRAGRLKDPFGHEWTVATHVEDVPPEEISRRMIALYS
jgi:PhnB protein